MAIKQVVDLDNLKCKYPLTERIDGGIYCIDKENENELYIALIKDKNAFIKQYTLIPILQARKTFDIGLRYTKNYITKKELLNKYIVLVVRDKKDSMKIIYEFINKNKELYNDWKLTKNNT